MGQTATPACWFTIGDLPSFALDAWKCLNPLELAKRRPRRGSPPDIIPGADGVIANPQWGNGAERILDWVIWPIRDHEGNRLWVRHLGLETNLAHIEDALAIPDNDDSTFVATLHLPSGATRSGPVQVADFDWSITPGGSEARAVLRLLIPAGQLTLDPEP